jgi:hypothetical protein
MRTYEVGVPFLKCIVTIATVMRLVSCFPPLLPGFEPRSGHVRFVVDKLALGRVFSEFFGFLCKFSFHRLLHTRYLSFGAGIVGKVVADVPI